MEGEQETVPIQAFEWCHSVICHLCRVADNTVWSHLQVASRSSEVNFTKNYTLLYLLFPMILNDPKRKFQDHAIT